MLVIQHCVVEMRILFCHRVGGAWGYITDGMINALKDRGYCVQRWDGQHSTWFQFDPVLYVGCSGHKQNIPNNRGNCKVAIHVNPMGPININGIMENRDNIKWVLNNKPDAVFGYGYDFDIVYWSHWENHTKWIPMPTAGDRTIYHDLYKPRQYDLVYLGGKWAYKSLTIDKYLMPVLSKIKNYKLYGWGDWPRGVSSGILDDVRVCDFFNSGLIAPCISEQHTHQYGIDIPERAFKAALCGCLIIHDSVSKMRDIIPSVIVANSPSDFMELCIKYTVDDVRRELAESQRNYVLNNHTYHHRMSRLFNDLGFVEESIHMLGDDNVA